MDWKHRHVGIQTKVLEMMASSILTDLHSLKPQLFLWGLPKNFKLMSILLQLSWWFLFSVKLLGAHTFKCYHVKHMFAGSVVI